MTWFEKFKSREDNLLAAGIAWTVGILFFSFSGFYLGTIVGKAHVYDLQVRDLAGPGLNGLIIGFVTGVVFALAVTFIYPSFTARDEKEEAEVASHPHFQ